MRVVHHGRHPGQRLHRPRHHLRRRPSRTVHDPGERPERHPRPDPVPCTHRPDGTTTRANRVFPTPAAPASTTPADPRTAAPTARTSASRPTSGQATVIPEAYGADVTDQHAKHAAFRALHDDGVFVIPNPWDAGSARFLASLGFPALATTSAGLAFARGVPDGACGLDETLENAREIVDATELPVSADLGSGFDDPAETVRRAVGVGLVGGSVEDVVDGVVLSRDEAVERVAAAVEAADGLPFVLTARAENFLHGRRDLDDTIARLKAYADAGADVLYAPGLPDADAIAAVCRAVRPVNVLANGTLSVTELGALGVRRISVGSGLARAAWAGVANAAREIVEGGTFTALAAATPHAELNRLMGGG
ncbi:oxaloacetate decarboxylase [Actinokineospora soli]|uniref:Oxaloacetate decarboxylase n=1 Tax=Actinokineospora soli TaxID=1048753 RepID=A0ABW2TZ34_9PSEU